MFWLFLFLAACIIVGLIARKKGRSGIGFFLASSVPAIPLMIVVSYALGDNISAKEVALPVVAFMCPIVGFIAAIMAKNDQQRAVHGESSSEYRKCPYCAESVRKEAIKCRHCQSELTAH